MYSSKKQKLKCDFSTFNKGGWEFLSFDVRPTFQQRGISTLIHGLTVCYLQFKMGSLFSTDSGQVTCSLDKYKALTPRPQSLPPFTPLPYWVLLQFGPPALVLLSLKASSIDQFFVQKQKLKIDRNIQFSFFFLNSRHCSWQMTAETVFPRIAKISMVRQPFWYWR